MFRKVRIALLATAALGMLEPDVVSARGGGGGFGGGMHGGMGGGVFHGGGGFSRSGSHAAQFHGGRIRGAANDGRGFRPDSGRDSGPARPPEPTPLRFARRSQMGREPKCSVSRRTAAHGIVGRNSSIACSTCGARGANHRAVRPTLSMQKQKRRCFASTSPRSSASWCPGRISIRSSTALPGSFSRI